MNDNRLKNIRGYLIDMDGTFYLGERLLNGALAFISALDARGCSYLFLTNNSSKNAGQYVAKLGRLGLEIGAEKVLTSGEATVKYLNARDPGARLFVAGNGSLIAEFQEGGFIINEHAPDILVLGFDTTLNYDKLRRFCDFVRAGLPYYATHPDINCPTETGYMPDIGAMIAFIHASTGRHPDRIIGKPNRYIAEVAADRLELPLNSLCMVGDRLYTDMALGAAAGLSTVLVLSGEARREDIPDSGISPDYVFDDLGALLVALDESE